MSSFYTLLLREVALGLDWAGLFPEIPTLKTEMNPLLFMTSYHKDPSAANCHFALCPFLEYTSLFSGKPRCSFSALESAIS